MANRYSDRAAPLWHPGTRETADHSIAYVVAVALLEGAISDVSFDAAHRSDQRIGALFGKQE